jgi:hypothetical protein
MTQRHILTTSGAFLLGITAVGLLATSVACSSAVPTSTPGIERLGRYVLQENTNRVELVVAYKYAAMSLGNEWLILEVAATSPVGKTARLERGKIFLTIPDGSTVPLATQKQFGEAYSRLRPQIAQANIVREPMNYFPPNREACSLGLFVAPGEGVVFNEVSLNDRRACQGKLLFRIPGGVQPGRYVLGIDLEESRIRIPFELPTAPPE